MRIDCIAALLMVAGTSAFAEKKTATAPAAATVAGPAASAATTTAPQVVAEKSKLDAYADKERTELHAFVEAAKAEFDKLEQKETARLEAVAKRTAVEPFTDAEQAKVKALQELMTSSSLEMRKKALEDLKDKLRTEKMTGIWSKYKAKKHAQWDKFQQEWHKLLTQPPLMIRSKAAMLPAPRALKK